jgi:predicted anti-sigma-YlaC factor YlaD
MRLSCEVIRDLLPLYYDKVCSKESSSLIEEHLANCPQCLDELKKLKVNFEKPTISDGEVKVMESISAKWKRDKKVSFTKGSMLVSALAAIICFIAYNVIGAKVLPDGTLIEPFALIPIGYIFVLVFIISLICNFVFLKKYKINTK